MTCQKSLYEKMPAFQKAAEGAKQGENMIKSLTKSKKMRQKCWAKEGVKVFSPQQVQNGGSISSEQVKSIPAALLI